MNHNVDSILKAGLAALGADGLCNPDSECGCGIEELAPCGCINAEECMAAKWTKPEEGDIDYCDEWQDGYYAVLDVAAP